MKKVLGAIVVLWAMFVSGCGTILNATSGDMYPYGGLARDCQFVAAALTGDTSPDSSGKGGAVALLIVVPAEMSLSLVGDTVMLPWTLFLHHKAADYDPVDGHEKEPKNSGPSLEQTVPAPGTPDLGEIVTPVRGLMTASQKEGGCDS